MMILNILNLSLSTNQQFFIILFFIFRQFKWRKEIAILKTTTIWIPLKFCGIIDLRYQLPQTPLWYLFMWFCCLFLVENVSWQYLHICTKLHGKWILSMWFIRVAFWLHCLPQRLHWKRLTSLLMLACSFNIARWASKEPKAWKKIINR